MTTGWAIMVIWFGFAIWLAIALHFDWVEGRGQKKRRAGVEKGDAGK